MLKEFVFSFLPSLHLSAIAPGGGAFECSGTITVDEVLQAEAARYAAQTSNDISTMQRLYADELVYVHSSTVQDTKTSYIESMRSGAVKYRKMNMGEVKVRTYGGVAIISGPAVFEVTVRGEDRTLNLLFQAVWVKRSAGLQFVSWQSTRLP
jgi:hypothetical protein